MRELRATAVAVIITLLAAVSGSAQGPDAAKPLGIRSLVPASVTAGDGPTTLTVEGWGFLRGAQLRVRAAGDVGTGRDYAATLDSPERLRVTLPADLTAKPGRLEVRVKNPSAASDWASLEIRPAASGSQGPAAAPRIDYVSPSEVAVGAHDMRVTIHGANLTDGSTVVLKSGASTDEVRGNLVNGMLVFTLPDAQAAAPRVVLVQVRNPAGLTSGQERIVIARAPATGESGSGSDPDAPYVFAIAPSRVDPRSGGEISLELRTRNVTGTPFALLRPEGRGEGARVALGGVNEATNGTFVTVLLQPRMLPDPGFYEIQLVNPNGRRSNWARFEVVGTAPAAGGSPAAVRAQFPTDVTLTAMASAVPVELTVRNTGRVPVRLAEFGAVDAAGRSVPVEGTLEVPAGAERTLRLVVPVPPGTGLGSRRGAELQMALTWRATEASGARPQSFPGRFPESGFATVRVRNEVGLVEIGREFLRPEAAGGPDGWRFFKTANPENQGKGEPADFYLFADAGSAQGRPLTEELYNFRPDRDDPARRNIFYLSLRASEITPADIRHREVGAMLGHVRSAPAPGLVPLYRWVRMAGQRAANHFLTIERDRSRLPAALRDGWTLEASPVGYVVARQ